MNYFTVRMRGLYDSYGLDGSEMARCLMRILTIEWTTVKGDWNPLSDDGKALPLTLLASAELPSRGPDEGMAAGEVEEDGQWARRTRRFSSRRKNQLD